MAVSERWLGIVLRIVRRYYPDGELAAYGPVVEEGQAAARRGERLELAILDPPDPHPDHLVAMRTELERSDLPVDADIRSLADLTLGEQDEVLERGVRFGG